MKTFKGFPPGKVPMVRLPSQFFTEMLGTIDDLDELKLTLYAFWALQQQESEVRYLLKREVLQDTLLLSGIDPDAERAAQRVSTALERAVQRGTLLHASVEGARGPEDLYFMNTTHGRNAVRAIAAGQFEPGDRDTPVLLLAERPNIYALYEENIGALTPLISEELRAAEQDYPPGWIEEAFRLAVERNARNWRYIRRVLERWQAEGKDRGLTKRPTQADRYRYIQGEFSDTVDY
ncbi:MAG: DnaD domain protein [Anaerolineae bacterium]|nr:DnaD domain protein [Anaerolineae bacterium]